MANKFDDLSKTALHSIAQFLALQKSGVAMIVSNIGMTKQHRDFFDRSASQ